MQTRLATRLRMLLLVAGALALCGPVWSDVRTRGGASRAERVCYCDCEAKASSTVCMHMCELTKYENRSWAASCKKVENQLETPPNEPGAHSTKDNGVQEAHR